MTSEPPQDAVSVDIPFKHFRPSHVCRDQATKRNEKGEGERERGNNALGQQLLFSFSITSSSFPHLHPQRQSVCFRGPQQRRAPLKSVPHRSGPGCPCAGSTDGWNDLDHSSARIHHHLQRDAVSNARDGRVVSRFGGLTCESHRKHRVLVTLKDRDTGRGQGGHRSPLSSTRRDQKRNEMKRSKE